MIERVADDAVEQAQVDTAPGDGRDLDHPLCLGGQRGESAAEYVAHTSRDSGQRVRATRRPRRVRANVRSLARRTDCRSFSRGHRRQSPLRRRHRGDRRARGPRRHRDTGELESQQILMAGQRRERFVERRVRLVGTIRAEHHDAIATDGVGGEAQDEQRRLVGPMQVVEHDQQRTVHGERARAPRRSRKPARIVRYRRRPRSRVRDQESIL